MLAYLSTLPAAVPDGLILVHNHVRPTRRLGSRGFRAWLSAPDPRLDVCGCGRAPDLGRHFLSRVPGRPWPWQPWAARKLLLKDQHS